MRLEGLFFIIGLLGDFELQEGDFFMANEILFKRVTTKEEAEAFHRVKQLVWEESGYDMEYGREGSDLYIAYINGVPGGTVEFTPYLEFSRLLIRNLFDDVVRDDMKVMELDSFAVLPEYRRKLVGHEIVRFMIYYAQTHGYTHGVAITAPKVFKSLNDTYHIRCEKVKDPFWYKGDEVIPALMHLKEVYDHLDDKKYSWYKEPLELKEGAMAR